ncbi:MAG TPA: hypothetical protein ENG89_01690, partial [Candidatus Moranbacteria bacterium]|nr:hypothetical protein [Candidatus Moranbacteria bacterium]
MLDPKNNPFGNASKIGSKVNKENISPHTMQDDLDVLSGKIIEKKRMDPKSIQNDATKGKNESEIGSPFTGSLPHQIQSDISPKVETHIPETEKHQDFKADKMSMKEKEKTLPKYSPTKSLKWNKILILVLSVVIILVFVAGGYYFWTTRSSVGPVAQPQPPEPPEEPVIDVPSERFSTENPNYLNVEVENVAADDIT